MKTITEFSGFTINEALKKMQAALPKPEIKPVVIVPVERPENPTVESPTAEKPAEVVPVEATAITQEMAQAFKLEGEKLEMFMIALDIASKKPHNIKRVVVLTLGEGEKAPEHSFEKNGKLYMLEHFFVPKPRREFKGKGGRSRDNKGGRGRDSKGGRKYDPNAADDSNSRRPFNKDARPVGGGGWLDPTLEQRNQPVIRPVIKPVITPVKR